MKQAIFIIVLNSALLISQVTQAKNIPEFTIEIRNHLFLPAEITIPRETKVKLIIINHDLTPEEFESFELNREKIIMGGRRGIIFIGPLSPGVYPFFGEFYPKTAQGIIKVNP